MSATTSLTDQIHISTLLSEKQKLQDKVLKLEAQLNETNDFLWGLRALATRPSIPSWTSLSEIYIRISNFQSPPNPTQPPDENPRPESHDSPG